MRLSNIYQINGFPDSNRKTNRVEEKKWFLSLFVIRKQYFSLCKFKHFPWNLPELNSVRFYPEQARKNLTKWRNSIWYIYSLCMFTFLCLISHGIHRLFMCIQSTHNPAEIIQFFVSMCTLKSLFASVYFRSHQNIHLDQSTWFSITIWYTCSHSLHFFFPFFLESTLLHPARYNWIMRLTSLLLHTQLETRLPRLNVALTTHFLFHLFDTPFMQCGISFHIRLFLI